MKIVKYWDDMESRIRSDKMAAMKVIKDDINALLPRHLSALMVRNLSNSEMQELSSFVAEVAYGQRITSSINATGLSCQIFERSLQKEFARIQNEIRSSLQTMFKVRTDAGDVSAFRITTFAEPTLRVISEPSGNKHMVAQIASSSKEPVDNLPF